MTYSKRTRDLAAQLCSMAACNDMLLASITWHMRARSSRASRELAFDALKHACSHGLQLGEMRYAEAEALIRTGWTP